MSEKPEAREFRVPAGRWYLTLAVDGEPCSAAQFLSEEQAKGIADIINRPIPMAARVEDSNRPRAQLQGEGAAMNDERESHIGFFALLFLILALCGIVGMWPVIEMELGL